MPYIRPEGRPEIDEALARVKKHVASVGDYNYAVTQLAVMHLLSQGTISYTHLNSTYGMLQAATAEFYRRMVAPYEDRKCQENGDVYPQPALDPTTRRPTVIQPDINRRVRHRPKGMHNYGTGTIISGPFKETSGSPDFYGVQWDCGPCYSHASDELEFI